MVVLPASTDPAVADLNEILDLGCAHGGELLTAGEVVVLRRIRGLDGEAASLYARLTARKPSVFHLPKLSVRRVSHLDTALAVLEREGLADGLVPWPERARHLRTIELTDACRAFGLPSSGKRAVLAERLAPHTGYIEGRWVRVRHKALLARLLRMAFLVPWPDRATLLLDRLGVVRWHPYALTSGAATWRDRRAMLAWEQLLTELTPADALDALARGAGAGGVGLDLRRSLVSVVCEAADAAMKRRDEGALPEAIALYRALVEGGHVRLSKVGVRYARAIERQGDSNLALQIVREALGSARPSEASALRRAGRRLAKAVGTGFPPARPLAEPRVRTLSITPAAEREDQRTRWLSPDGSSLEIEPAVICHLALHGRSALYGEGIPWRTLVAVLCADLYFLPVPGALPVRFLSGPLDLGTPAFRDRRAQPFQELLSEIDAGNAHEIAARNDERFRGTRLWGARWDLVDRDTLLALARAMKPSGLRILVETLALEGMGAAAGLPDLAILPGDRVRLPFAWPGGIPETLVLAEVKGPGDTVRDAQRIWHDRLLKAGVCVELWQVHPR